MSYWACAQLESNRTRLALLKIMGVSQLFPAYCFVLIVSGWWNARWQPGVVRLIMNGLVPAVVPNEVVDEIKSRERGGFVVLPKPRGPIIGARMRVLQGPLQGQIGLLAALRPHERVVMLLQMLGGQQRVELARNVIEAV